MLENYRIAPLGDSAVTVTFSEKIDEYVHGRVLAFAGMLESQPLPGVIEVVSSYTSVTIFYNPIAVWKTAGQTEQVRTEMEWPRAVMEQVQPLINAKEKKHLRHLPCPSPYAVISGMLKKMMTRPPQSGVSSGEKGRTVCIPVCYGGRHGPDLQAVADYNHLTPEDVIAVHSGGSYRVFMIGFLPGFPYLGGLPKQIVIPRRAKPRLSVPAGSVGIAGEQTGVYPFASPGGWQIIGQTPAALFDPEKSPPSLLRTGDHVRFKAINENEFNNWKGGERL